MLVRVSVALTVPLTMGLKVMVKGTLWPAGMVNGRESPPTLKTELLLLAAVTVTLAPLAVIVPDAVPLWPTTTLPKPRVVGLTPSVPTVAVVPVPESESVTVEFEAVELIVMLPVRVPVAVGVNFALIVQLDPGAIGL